MKSSLLFREESEPRRLRREARLPLSARAARGTPAEERFTPADLFFCFGSSSLSSSFREEFSDPMTNVELNTSVFCHDKKDKKVMGLLCRS